MDTSKEERNFELRSEKTRSLIGEIPSVLTRYGIIIISMVLLLVIGITTYFPYRKVFYGEVVIYTLPMGESTDSIESIVKLLFTEEVPVKLLENQRIVLLTEEESINGRLLQLNTHRDTLGRQEALIRLPLKTSILEYSTLNFRIPVEQGTIAQQLIGIKN